MILFNRTASWNLFNSSLKNDLQIPEDQQCRLYSDLSLALLEIIQGTTQFMAHKKSLILAKGVSMAHEFMLPQIYREGLNVQWSECHVPLDPAWVALLKPDTSLCLHYEDHPVTGEVYAWTNLDRVMNDKKIFSIRVSHFSHRKDHDYKLSPYSIRLCVLENGMVFAVLGNKFKVPAVFSNTLQRPHGDDVKSEIKKSLHENESAVRQFEAQIIAAGAELWKYAGLRRWDRSIICFRKVNADFLQKHLIAVDPNYEKHVFTLVDCGQDFSKPLWNWWHDGPDFEQQRGLLILSAECLSWTKTTDELKKAIGLAQQLHWEW